MTRFCPSDTSPSANGQIRKQFTVGREGARANLFTGKAHRSTRDLAVRAIVARIFARTCCVCCAWGMVQDTGATIDITTTRYPHS